MVCHKILGGKIIISQHFLFIKYCVVKSNDPTLYKSLSTTFISINFFVLFFNYKIILFFRQIVKYISFFLSSNITINIKYQICFHLHKKLIKSIL